MRARRSRTPSTTDLSRLIDVWGQPTRCLGLGGGTTSHFPGRAPPKDGNDDDTQKRDPHAYDEHRNRQRRTPIPYQRSRSNQTRFGGTRTLDLPVDVPQPRDRPDHDHAATQPRTHDGADRHRRAHAAASSRQRRPNADRAGRSHAHSVGGAGSRARSQSLASSAWCRGPRPHCSLVVRRGPVVTDNRRPPGTDESYWIASSPSTSYPALTSDVTVDAAVIGGGIAGICTAWELTKTGRSVALLEADRIVTGTTGYTTAKLTALHGMIYAQLRSSFDDEVAQLYARSQTDAIEHVAATVHDLGIGCDFERRPALTYVESSEQVDLIGHEVDLLAGLD